MTNLRDIAASRGYYDRINVTRLLDDLHRQPGCDKVSLRALGQYLAGTTTPRNPDVIMGLARVLDVDAETILRGVKSGV